MPRMDAVDALRWLGGTARWKDLARHTTQHSVRMALAARRIERPALGVYSLVDLPPARLAAARAHGVLSHTSAAQHWGIELLGTPKEVHVTVPLGSSPAPQPGVVLHRRNLDDTEVSGVATTPLRTVLDCATVLPFDEALAVADSALRIALLDVDQIRQAAVGSSGPGRPARIKVAERADGRAANPFESALRAIVLDAGLDGFQPQYPIGIPGGTCYVDLGDPELKLALEADSFAFHGSRQALERDCRRYDELVRAGWLVLRYAWEHVVLERAWTTEILLDTCRLRSRSPGRSEKSRGVRA